MLKRGFTLIELVIYLSVFSIFILLTMGFFSEFSQKILKDFEENRIIVRNACILDILKRDLIESSFYLDEWDEVNFVFRKNKLDGFSDVCWQARKDEIFRIEGCYNYIQKKWIKKSVALLDCYSTKFSLVFERDESNKYLKRLIINFNQNDIFCFSSRNKVLIDE